ncbi:hypothetical protein CSPAE12_01791 [Colletotrichum incanum]|nr:hypothetical protein CSPAE12_01791 [Colletotrichum incanum]
MWLLAVTSARQLVIRGGSRYSDFYAKIPLLVPCDNKLLIPSDIRHILLRLSRNGYIAWIYQ